MLKVSRSIAVLMLVSTVPFKAFAFDINTTLKFLCNEPSGYGLYRDCLYTPPMGGYVNNSETEWDNTVWGDSFDKPPYTTLQNNSALAALWYNSMGSVFVGFPGLQSAVMNLQSAANITALTGDVTASGPGSSVATLTNSGVSAGSYTSPNITVDSKGRITAASSASPSPSTPSRSINTAFQISSSRGADVVYSIPVRSNATVLLGSQVSATFQYADDSSMSTNLVTLPGDQFGIDSGILVSGIGSLKLSGYIPSAKWVKITLTNIAGTPVIGAIQAQESLR